jgi:NTE family protein
MISTESALVLAGGGVAGIAGETGFLLGLQHDSPGLVRRLLTHSTTLLGTSAGSTVAAQIATGNTCAPWILPAFA